ncbi:hypothetical protein DSM106972_004630 [Dulcicalothrix desertica PCC 7102]|uniref:Uncharacterized protein n=1 Tax=Dulcicalothrix desertica PCC 7102 TaxID=232991 RepID=A0A433VV55_9CYAN|nr:hypothetical protein DSM106972_004630 [Dulcicalothrix desertica PCC 7102]TWH41051.1 hypothetical protein CAL7102_10417 [Dulcicalothrix desertica PCC 7102]
MIMDLTNLKWTKNITPLDNEQWAYSNYERGDLFKLNWKKNKINANKPVLPELAC